MKDKNLIEIFKKEETKAYHRAYGVVYRKTEKSKAYKRKYQKSPKYKAWARKYNQSERGKEKSRKYMQSQTRKDYEKTDAFKESRRKYMKSEKGRKAIKRYMHSPKGRLYKFRHDHRRKQRQKDIVHSFTAEEWMKKKAKTKGFCVGCKEYHGINKLELDHIFPISKAQPGQIYTIKDVQPLCRLCNLRKLDRVPEGITKSYIQDTIPLIACGVQ